MPPPDPLDPEAVVRAFWRLMASNDFASVCSVLAPDFVMDWPKSGDRIRGGANFARMNAEPISFFTVRDGRITRLVEYWPDPFAPAQNRRHLTERID